MSGLDSGQVAVLMMKSLLVVGLLHTLYKYQAAKQREGKPAAGAAAGAAAPAAARAPVATGMDNATGAPAAAAEEPASKAKLVTILFASQTGTAEGFAATIAGEAKMQGFRANLQCVEDYTDEGIEQLAEEELVVMVAATYGEGEPTDDAMKFKKWLEYDGHSDDELKGVNYCVFGLGDRTYEQYCAMGHFYHDRMTALGGTALLPAGEGDDAADIMADFEVWRADMWAALRRHAFGADAGEVSFTLETDDGTFTFGFPAPSQNAFVGAVSVGGGAEPKPLPASRNPLIDGKPWITAPLLAKRELHAKPASPRSCLHLEFDISAAKGAAKGAAYTAGDHVGLFCQNDPKLAAALSRRLRCKLSDGFTLRAADPKSGGKQYHIPSPTTVSAALTRYLDLSRPPSQQLLLVLAESAAEAGQRQQLLWLASREGKDDYAEQLVGPAVTVLEVLYGFGSIEVGLDQIAEHLPRLQPRLYSISSSSKLHPTAVHVTAAVVRYDKPAPPAWLVAAQGEVDRAYDGVCTGWLARMSVGKKAADTVQIYLRENLGFKLPPASKRTMLPTPAIMVGPGTGLAPFRGFIQDRDAAGDGGFDELYFGCRSASEDYIYKDELEPAAVQPGGVLAELHTAFSRDQTEKVYVQHLLGRPADKARLWKLLDQQQAVLYVCGDGLNMASDVNTAVREIVATEGGKSPAEVDDYMTMLKSTARYQQDVW